MTRAIPLLLLALISCQGDDAIPDGGAADSAMGDVPGDQGAVADTLADDSSTPVDPSAHDYFDMLAAHPNVHYSLEGRSNEEIWPLLIRNQDNVDPDELFYDSAVDGAANRFRAGDGSSGTPWGPGRDGRNRFEAISNTTALFYWEARWSDRFTDKDENSAIGGELETHKAFILLGTLVDDRAVEIRSRFNQATAAEGVARTDIRQYGSAAGVSPAEPTDGGDSIAVRDDATFVVQPNTWTYHWVFIDMSGETLTYWIADESQGLSVVYDNIDIAVEPELEIVGFEFRHNSSQGGGTAPAGFIWNRNLAVLTNVSLSDASALVDQR